VICRTLDVARSTAYYHERERVPIVDEVLAQRIKHFIDAEPYLGYRMVWARLREKGVLVNRKRFGASRNSSARSGIAGSIRAAIRASKRVRASRPAWIDRYNERPHLQASATSRPLAWRERDAAQITALRV